jgi:tyrosyl-tRNA synthetase
LPGLAAIAGSLTQLGFTASNGEAKRKVAEGAVRLNDEPVSDPAMAASPGKLSLGKKKHGLLTRSG